MLSEHRGERAENITTTGVQWHIYRMQTKLSVLQAGCETKKKTKQIAFLFTCENCSVGYKKKRYFSYLIREPRTACEVFQSWKISAHPSDQHNEPPSVSSALFVHVRSPSFATWKASGARREVKLCSTRRPHLRPDCYCSKSSPFLFVFSIERFAHPSCRMIE